MNGLHAGVPGSTPVMVYFFFYCRNVYYVFVNQLAKFSDASKILVSNYLENISEITHFYV